jgi:uncharacterized membrane protein
VASPINVPNNNNNGLRHFGKCTMVFMSNLIYVIDIHLITFIYNVSCRHPSEEDKLSLGSKAQKILGEAELEVL